MNLLDKLKVPEFDESLTLDVWHKTSGVGQSPKIFFMGARHQHSLLTKEIEKRNRVIEKLIEQRNNRPQHNNMVPTQDYRKQEDQELLSIIEGV